MFTDEEKKKLPKWAYYKVILMERALESREEQIKKFENPEESRIRWVRLLDEKHGIPDSANVEFRVGQGRITVSYDNNGELNVRADSQLVIEPRAANSVRVESKKF